MTCYTTTFSTPLGRFSLAVNAAGEIVATAFGDITALRSRLRPAEFTPDRRRTVSARAQVEEYFAGKRTEFSLPLRPRGTAFQQQVWRALTTIPYGETRSYKQLATALDHPAASRAVGRANATNPICLIVPCHRVIGSDGSLTGFAFGETIKRRLLDHESRRTTRARAA